MENITTKKCTKCGVTKDISEFFKNSRYFANPRVNKDRKTTICKECTRKCTRLNQIKNPERYRQYGRLWTLNNPEKRKALRQKYWASPKGIHQGLLKRGRENVLISKQDFVDWYNKQDKICIYCGIPEVLVAKFAKGKQRGRLTIDRIDPKGKYKEGNLALACGICNFVKSDIFTKDEMLKIGLIIKNKWEALC